MTVDELSPYSLSLQVQLIGCGLQLKGQPDKRGHAVPTPRRAICDPEKQHPPPGWLPTFIVLRT